MPVSAVQYAIAPVSGSISQRWFVVGVVGQRAGDLV
jgi:hypothetical protein